MADNSDNRLIILTIASREETETGFTTQTISAALERTNEEVTNIQSVMTHREFPELREEGYTEPEYLSELNNEELGARLQMGYTQQEALTSLQRSLTGKNASDQSREIAIALFLSIMAALAGHTD